LCFYIFTILSGYSLLNSIEVIVNSIFPFYQEAYLENIVGNRLNTGLGLFFNSFIFLLILWSHNKSDAGANQVITKLSIIEFVISPMGLYLDIFGRIGLYFTPFILLSLPYAIIVQKAWQIRIVLVVIFIAFNLYIFFDFFHNPIWIDKFSTYKTVFNQ
jgi:hypothetical protein